MTHQEKLYLRAFAFISACIITISSIFYCGFDSFADDNINFIDSFGVTDVCVTTDDFQSNSLLSSDDSRITTYQDFIYNGCTIPFNQLNNNVNYNQNFTDYVAVIRSDSAIIGFFLCPSGSRVVVANDSINILYSEKPEHIQQNNNNVMPIYFYSSSGQYWSQDLLQTHDEIIDNSETSVYSINGTYKFVSTSLEVNGFNGNYSQWDKFSSSLSGNINSNFGSSGETAENNLYFNDFDISYSVSDFLNGNVVLYGTPNSYQLEHSEAFTLVYSFTFDIDVVDNNIGGLKYKGSLVSSSYQVPLQEFINNNCSKVHYLKDIESFIQVSNIWGSIQGNEITNLYQLFNYFGFGNYPGDSHNVINDLGKVQWRKASLKCSAYLVKNGNNISDSLNNHSGIYSKTYNFLTGVQSAYTGNSITTNNNKYSSSESGYVNDQTEVDTNNTTDHVTSNNIPSSANPTSGNNNVTVNNGNGGVTINNTNNVSGGSGGSGTSGGTSNSGLVNTFFDTFNPFKMLFNKLTGDTELMSEEVQETIGANNFFTFVSDSFGFMPSSFWVSISTFFGACLVVLIIAFIFKVLISIL